MTEFLYPRKRPLQFLALLLCSVFAPALFADCTWVTAPSAVPFGTYSVFSATPLTPAPQFRFNCAAGDAVTITITRGGAPTFAPRQMRSGGNVASYNLYTNAGGTIVWGDGSGGTIYTITNNTGGNLTFTAFIYGIMPAGQDLAPGVYADTVVLTLAWTNQNCQGQCQNNGAGSLPRLNINVSATVNAECRADTFNLIFGNYDPFAGAALNQSNAVKVYCTRTTPATFALDNGANAAGVQKRMASGASFLNYTATLASASGTSGSTLTPINGGVTLNGSVPTAQDVPIGAYIDTLQVLVNY